MKEKGQGRGKREEGEKEEQMEEGEEEEGGKGKGGRTGGGGEGKREEGEEEGEDSYEVRIHHLQILLNVLTQTWSSANLRRAFMGSPPGERTKMSGAHE